MDSQPTGNHVCVIGAGALGLVATKNLVEQGLKVTTLERNDYVGGLWRVSTKSGQVSALESTTANTSKYISAFTDFPMPDEYASYPSANDLAKYLEAYAQNFDIIKCIEFGVTVKSVIYDKEKCGWLVVCENKQGRQTTRQFDRVVLATGMLGIKREPTVPNIEKFSGIIIHAREFKDPKQFRGKNVLVVGIGSTGADTVCSLMKAGVGRLYLSHRRQFLVLPRRIGGRPIEHWVPRRFYMLFRAAASISPIQAGYWCSKLIQMVQRAALPFIKNHPSFHPSRLLDGICHRLPFVSDDLLHTLQHGDVRIMQAVHEVTGPSSVLFKDGRHITDLDAIIFCSGYHFDFSVVKGVDNPTDPTLAPDNYQKLRQTQHYDPSEAFPRLYHGFLSESHPETLAILGHLYFLRSTYVLYDLVTMALASVWSGNYPLPSTRLMKQDIDAHYGYIVRALENAPTPLGYRTNHKASYEWMNRAAGTGVVERLGGWNWASWVFWWKNRQLYYLLMDGIDCPAVYRLFNTGQRRKYWSGAEQHIRAVNDLK